MSATKHVQPGPVSKRPTFLHCITGIFALAIACASALCIYLYVTPAHASSENRPTNAAASSGLIAFDDTETETPSRTPTHTPTATSTSTPTATNTSTPVSSPSATHIATPSPVSKKPAKATALPSSTVTSKQTPALVNVTTGGSQTPVASSASTNKQGSQTGQATNASRGSFPALPLMISLAGFILSGVLLKKWWGNLHRASRKTSTPILPDAVTASASSAQDTAIAQRAFDLAVPWGGVLTKDQFAQALQQRSVSMVSPLPPVSSVSNVTPYPDTMTSASFYSYPGFKPLEGFVAQAVDINAMSTIPHTPVPAADQSVLRVQTASRDSTDTLEVSDATADAWVQTYIY